MKRFKVENAELAAITTKARSEVDRLEQKVRLSLPEYHSIVCAKKQHSWTRKESS